MKQALTLSIIIPVYNEEKCIAACLDAIAAQTSSPDEVIVVDNNSTDKSVEIAKGYPFVRVVHEPQQGFTYARNAGFNAAHCDILGRIDADAVVAVDWVERVRRHFADESLDGLTGLGSSDVLPRMSFIKTVLPSWLYFMWSIAVYRLPVLWGANMVITKKAWRTIKPHVCMDNHIVHEDQDISLCILESGGTLKRDNYLRVTISGQTYHYLPKLWHYTLRMWTTKRHHAQRAAFRNLHRPYPLALSAFLWIIPAPILLPLFFGSSALLFPIDYVIKRAGHEDDWLD